MEGILAPARSERYGATTEEMLEESEEGVVRPIWSYDHWGMVGVLVDEEEWQTFRKEARYLEKEHLEIRMALRDAEAGLQADPGNEGLKAQTEELKKRLEELDRQAPWIASDVPVELALWGVPHG